MKFCKYCNKDYGLESDHWRKHKTGYLECRIRAADTRRKKRAENNLKKYGTETPLQDKNYQIYIKARRLETMRKKYGVDNAMQSVKFRDKQKASKGEKRQSFRTISPENRLKARKKIANKYNIMLENGQTLEEFHQSTGVSREWAYKVLRDHGESRLIAMVDEYRNDLLSLDSSFIELIKDFEGLSVFSGKAIPGIKYIPDFLVGDRLCIKLDRLYWSSSVIVKDPMHSRKIREEIAGAGYDFLQIRANEISRKKEVIKSIISRKYNVSTRINSKKCEVRVVPPKTADRFFEDNHMLGGHPACRAYGLYHGNTLVMCILLRQLDKTGYIERVCTLNKTVVTSGLNKLVTWVKNNIACRTIVTYCDLRYDDPSEIESIGFEHIKTKVDWQWTNGVDTFHKSKCRSKMDDRLLPESSYAAEMGFHRIYDSGKAKYLMINKKG